MSSRSFSMSSDAIGRIEAAEWLDGPAYTLANAVALPQRLAGRPGQRVRNALHGTWFGHPVHPMFVTIPIGTWTLALGFDTLEAVSGDKGQQYGWAADLAVRAGAAGAIVAAATGLADWQQTHGRARRVGLVHAAVNSAALSLQLISVALRRRGRRKDGRLASAAAWGTMFVGAYLGGHLVYRRRQGVDQADRSVEPRDFVPVLPADELLEDKPRRALVRDEVELADIPVVLVRRRGRIFALAESPLGFRHGPKSVLDEHSQVILFASAKPLARRYDDDLLAELRRDGIAADVLTVGPGGDFGADAPAWPDAWLAPLWLLMAQQYALHQSVRLNLRPDNPFAGGIVNRVVQGVTIHDHTA